MDFWKRTNWGLIVLIAALFGMYGCASQQGSRVVHTEDYSDEKLLPDYKVVDREGKAEVASPVISTTGMITTSGAFPTGDKATSVVFIEKTIPAQTQVGQQFNFVTKVTNLTDALVKDVVVYGELSDNFDITSSDPDTQVDPSGARVYWNVGDLEPRGTKIITVQGSPSGAGELEFCCTEVTYNYDPTLCMTASVVQPALTITKEAPYEVMICDTIPYRIVVSNTGTGDALNVQVNDPLPSGLRTLSGESTIVSDIGTLHAGESREITIDVEADRTGTFDNTVSAVASGGLSADSNSTSTLVTQPVLTITKTGDAKRYIGTNVDYQVTVTNLGNAPAVSTVLTDTIPLNTSFVSASGGGVHGRSSQTEIIRKKVTKTEVVHTEELSPEKLLPDWEVKEVEVVEEVEIERPGSGQTGVVKWHLGTLQPQESRTVNLTVRADRAGQAENCATASAVCADTVTDCATTLLTGIPAVLLEVIDLSDPIEVGGIETYVITVTNQGTAADTGITIVCTLEEGTVGYVSSDGPTSGTIVGNVVTFAPLAYLAPKDKATWRLNVKALNPGDVRIRIRLDTDQLERDVEETEATRFYE